MKLPRWLSPVRTVEAETGWPRALCRRFLRARPLSQRAVAVWLLVLAFVGLPTIGAMLELVWAPLIIGSVEFAPPLDAGPTAVAWAMLRDLAPLVPVVIAHLAVFWILLHAGIAFLCTRAVARYRADPWCFKCKYPVPPPGGREGGSYSICPECGEPIPPEIAKLAAERADK